MTKSIRIRGLEIGEGRPKICVPIMAPTLEGLKIEVCEAIKEQADLIEWRVDFFEKEKDLNSIIYAAKVIRELLKDTPLIFTFRTKNEGGEKEIIWDDYKNMLLTVANTHTIDLVDVEYYFQKDKDYFFLENLKSSNTSIILSNHHFDRTPSCKDLLSILEEMKECKGDMVKLAVMPHNKAEVLELLTATTLFAQRNRIPIVTMSMGALGMISRVLGGFTGSAITFGAVKNVSAPGQMPIKKLRTILHHLEVQSQDNIFLIGFMGTGKSTVSRQLKERLDMNEVDLDAYIEEKEEKSIQEIFRDHGESYFRTLETNALRAVAQEKNQIVSCGGGAVLKEENIEIMKKFGKVVLLTATAETILERVRWGNNRPILNGNMNIAFIEKMQKSRTRYYEKAAHVMISTDEKTVPIICEEIVKELNRAEEVFCNGNDYLNC